MPMTVSVDAPERAMLRAAHRVAGLSPQLEGTGVLQLPGGVYGFTHAPAAENAPLFGTATPYSFEVHRLQESAVLLAYVDQPTAAVLEHSPEDFTITAYPFPQGSSTVLVAIEWSRLQLIKRYVTPNEQGGIELRVFGK